MRVPTGEVVAVCLQSGFMVPPAYLAASIQVPAGNRWHLQTRLFLEGLRNRPFEQSCKESGEKLQHPGSSESRAVTTPGAGDPEESIFRVPEGKPS